MSKAFQLFILASICSYACMAQNSQSFYDLPYESRNSGSFDQSAKLLSLGLGVPNVAGDPDGHNGFPPLYVKFESGFLRDDVGLGGYVSSGWGTSNGDNKNNNNNNNETNFSAFSIGILGYYHFNKLIPIKEMDAYVASGFAYRVVSYSDYYNNKNDAQFIWHLGIRYYIKPKFSFYLETGYDAMSKLNLGVTLKLK